MHLITAFFGCWQTHRPPSLWSFSLLTYITAVMFGGPYHLSRSSSDVECSGQPTIGAMACVLMQPLHRLLDGRSDHHVLRSFSTSLILTRIWVARQTTCKVFITTILILLRLRGVHLKRLPTFSIKLGLHTKNHRSSKRTRVMSRSRRHLASSQNRIMHMLSQTTTVMKSFSNWRARSSQPCRLLVRESTKRSKSKMALIQLCNVAVQLLHQSSQLRFTPSRWG